MTSFDAREKAFEDQYMRDQDLQFRVTARRNKLLGYWAADKLGKTGAEREEYAQLVVMVDFDEPGDDDVMRKVSADLDAAQLPIGPTEVRHQMTTLLDIAKKQMMDEA